VLGLIGKNGLGGPLGLGEIMAGRGPQTFQKRQKEQQRKEKRQEKLARRQQRKQEEQNSLSHQELPAADGAQLPAAES
jgi:DNA-binding protein H-NS